MPYLFLAALCLVLLILLLQKLEHAETTLLAHTLKWTLAGLMVLSALYLTLVGRLFHVAALVVLLILLLRKDVRVWMVKKRPLSPLPPPMTKKDAAALLNVDVNASPEAIQKAFQHITIKDSTHRDHLTQALTLLLKKQKKT
jgi:hypothetical protein